MLRVCVCVCVPHFHKTVRFLQTQPHINPPYVHEFTADCSFQSQVCCSDSRHHTYLSLACTPMNTHTHTHRNGCMQTLKCVSIHHSISLKSKHGLAEDMTHLVKGAKCATAATAVIFLFFFFFFPSQTLSQLMSENKI